MNSFNNLSSHSVLAEEQSELFPFNQKTTFGFLKSAEELLHFKGSSDPEDDLDFVAILSSN